MCAIQNKFTPKQQTNQQQPPPEPKHDFRWSIFAGIPLALFVFFFLLNGIEPSFEFEDLMQSLGVINENRYVRMACLCVVGIVILLIVKSRNHSRK